MNKDLVRGITFEIDEEKRIATMRVDWVDGKLCNQWNSTNLQMEPKEGLETDLSKNRRS